MDTRLCDAVYALADGADLLVIESTYLDADADLAADNFHLTAAQAARVAARVRGPAPRADPLLAALRRPGRVPRRGGRHFDGDIVVAADLARVAVPRRR